MNSSDEILYSGRIHPEQYSNTLSKAQIKSLHTALHYVTSLAVETKSDSSKFPEDWLFKHRWGKGKKDSTNRLPNGAKIVFMTVGGRTSAVVPSVQKKTGPVAGDIKEEEAEDDREEKPKPKSRKGGKKAKAGQEDDEDNVGEAVKDIKMAPASITPKRASRASKTATPGSSKAAPATNGVAHDSEAEEAKPKGRKRKAKPSCHSEPTGVDETVSGDDDEAEKIAPAKKRKSATKSTKKAANGVTVEKQKKVAKSAKKEAPAKVAEPGRRRSARVSGAGF